MAFSEVFTSLQNGTIDAQDIYLFLLVLTGPEAQLSPDQGCIVTFLAAFDFDDDGDIDLQDYAALQQIVSP